MTLDLNGLLYQGTEAFTVGEKIKVFFSELSLSIDQFNGSVFNSSVHVVDARKTLKTLKEKNNYFKYSSYQIPTSVFFNPNKISFIEYTELCLEAIDMLDHTNDELQDFYEAIKETISSGKMPFSVMLKKEDRQLTARKTRLETKVDNTAHTHRALNQVYPNLATIEKTIDGYNRKVSLLKSRDAELTTKRVNNLIDLLKILKSKVDVSDVKLTQNELEAIKRGISRINDLVSVTGTMMAMVNDLSRVIELQIETLSTLATK